MPYSSTTDPSRSLKLAVLLAARADGTLYPRRAVLPCLLLLLIPSRAFAQNSPPHDDYKISTSVELVLLDVSVKDPKGGYVSGLTKDQFRVYENGALQKITEFSSADTPVTAGLVMDDSGSMRSKRSELNAAGVAFAEASNPEDQIFVVNFNDKVWRSLPKDIPFTGDIRLLRAALSQGRTEGRTALYDAIAMALSHLDSGRREKKTLVVVSDGGDNASTRKLKDLMALIQESRATIYTVGLFDEGDPDNNPGVLKRIASVSGGECFLPEKLDEIGPICKKIAKDIRNRYTIGYTPARGNDPKPLRKIRVVAEAPERGKIIVRTRASYYLRER